MVQLRGYGMSADAHHITQPPEDGSGAALAMERALENAGALPNQVLYVNAHGTSTPLGDVAELRAIQRVFGASGPPSQHEEHHRVSAEIQRSAILILCMLVEMGCLTECRKCQGYQKCLAWCGTANVQLAHQMKIAPSGTQS